MKQGGRHRPALVLITLLSAAIWPFTTQQALARADSTQSIPEPISSEARSVRERQSGLEYWTPQQMARATSPQERREPSPPLDKAGEQESRVGQQAEAQSGFGSSNKVPSTGSPGGFAPTLPSSSSPPEAGSSNGLEADGPGAGVIAGGASAGVWTGRANGLPAKTIGKVFFVDETGNNRMCSATALNSPSKNVVFTAGHCVHGGGAGHRFFTNWTFVPGYRNGRSPYGRWSAVQLISTEQWARVGDRRYDIGAAVISPNQRGQHLVDVVGGQGILWNTARRQGQLQFGYPVEPPFDGKSLQFCEGTSQDVGGTLSLACNMTRGASGGPWLARFDGRSGWLDSVNSWLFWDSNGVVYEWNGPYFGDEAARLFAKVENL